MNERRHTDDCARPVSNLMCRCNCGAGRHAKRVAALEARILALEYALSGEVEQHEAFYLQSGTKSEVHENGIAFARSLLTG